MNPLWRSGDIHRESQEHPMPPLPKNAHKSKQNIITLGLEIEFLLLNLKMEDDPYEIVRDALEDCGQVPLDPFNPYFRELKARINPTEFLGLPEVRCDIRLDRVCWFPHGKTNQNTIYGFRKTIVQTVTRYNRKHFNLMHEYGLDPLREVGTLGVMHEVMENGEIRRRESMEVSTPIMRERSWRRVVNNMLFSLWAIGESRLNVEFNEDTGLHIHIGRRGGWSICQLKKIWKAIVVFEEAMDAQHPESRVGGAADKISVIASNVELMKIHRWPKLQRVRHIDSQINSQTAKTRTEGLTRICELTNGLGKCSKYNFLPVKESGTVEFRQAIASLDQNKVTNWVDMVLDFVSAAITTTREEFEQWATDMDDDRDYILESFLAHGREYRLRSMNWAEDFEDELPEVVESRIFPGSPDVQSYKSTYLLEEKTAPNKKGKGITTAAHKPQDDYGSGHGRNLKGKCESSKMGAQYQENTRGFT